MLAVSLYYPPLTITAPCNRLITHGKCVFPLDKINCCRGLYHIPALFCSEVITRLTVTNAIEWVQRDVAGSRFTRSLDGSPTLIGGGEYERMFTKIYCASQGTQHKVTMRFKTCCMQDKAEQWSYTGTLWAMFRLDWAVQVWYSIPSLSRWFQCSIKLYPPSWD